MYPDSGDLKSRVMFNQTIKPRTPKCSQNTFSILWCYNTAAGPFSQRGTPNHFVPLINTTKKQFRTKKASISSGKRENTITIVNNEKPIKVKYFEVLQKPNNTANEKQKIIPNFKGVLKPLQHSPLGCIVKQEKSNESILENKHEYKPVKRKASSSTISKQQHDSSKNSYLNDFFPPAKKLCTNLSEKESLFNKKNSSNNCSVTNSKAEQISKPCSPTIKPNIAQQNICSDAISQRKTNSPSETLLDTPVSIDTEAKNVKALPPSLINVDISKFESFLPSLNESERYRMITHCYVPEDNFVFPKHTGRVFKKKWLKSFSWLRYSKDLNGGFCLPCVLYHKEVKLAGNPLKNLVSQPYKHFNGANTFFQKHETCPLGLHKKTMPKYIDFVSRMEGKTEGVNRQLDKSYKKEVQENRKCFEPVVDTVKLLGRQGIPFRGHRDSLKDQPKIGESGQDNNPGNFIEVLNYRVRGGDEMLEKQLNGPRNAKYTSATSQNEILECFGELIVEELISEIIEAKFYSILADEASDVAMKEQLSLVLRFVDKDHNVREEFIKYCLCEKLTGEALANLILDEIKKLGLDIQNCRGQGYDGAGAVSGKEKGVANRIKEVNPKALNTHCACHRLNLCVCKSCTVQRVKNVMNQIEAISIFFNFSTPRRQELENQIIDYKDGDTSGATKLINVSRTRWVAKVDGLNIFYDLFIPVVNALEQISLNLNKEFNDESSAKATSLYKLVSSFEFIIALVVTRNVLDYLLPVTILLQGKTTEITDCVELINSLKITCQEIRNSCDDYHQRWFEDATQIAEFLHIEVKQPRYASRQTCRDNPPSETVSEYFKRSLTIPFVDHLGFQINFRFSEESLVSYSGLYIVPYKMLSAKSMWKENFFKCFNFYILDMPSPSSIQAEMDLWENHWKSCSSKLLTIPSHISEVLKLPITKGFVNIYVALRILATLPVTTCECERSFSAMRHLKKWTQSTMGQTRLNGIGSLFFHRNINIPNDKVIDRFAEKHGRRINLK